VQEVEKKKKELKELTKKRTEEEAKLRL